LTFGGLRFAPDHRLPIRSKKSRTGIGDFNSIPPGSNTLRKKVCYCVLVRVGLDANAIFQEDICRTKNVLSLMPIRPKG